MSGTIDLACTLNQRYAVPFAAMIASLLGTRRGGRPLRIHVLDNGVTAGTRDLVERSFAGDCVRFEWLAVSRSALDEMASGVRRRRSPIFYQTLLLPEALPASVTRVLYLDIDLICLQPIECLWDIDLDGRPLAAVQDMAIPTLSSPQGVREFRALGLPADAPYFNAGVMLIDLALWRSRRIVSRAIEYLRIYPGRASTCAQDAYNATIRDWKPLPLAWNVIASLAGRPFFRPDALDAEQYREALAHPALVHFAGRMKPWMLRTGNRFDALFREWCGRLPAAAGVRGSWRDAAAGYYDRSLRTTVYSVERFFWDRRP